MVCSRGTHRVHAGGDVGFGVRRLAQQALRAPARVVQRHPVRHLLPAPGVSHSQPCQTRHLPNHAPHEKQKWINHALSTLIYRLGVLLANVCTPVRLAIYPWIATVIQGVIDMYEGVSMGNACLPLRVAVLRGLVVVMPVARGEEVPPVLRSNMHRMLNQTDQVMHILSLNTGVLKTAALCRCFTSFSCCAASSTSCDRAHMRQHSPMISVFYETKEI